jgi:hypothetical protein
MSLVLSREEIQAASPRYKVERSPQPKPAAPAKDPVADAIDRFSSALAQVTQVNAASSIAITELLKQMSQEIKAASPPRPKSWTFKATKDKAGNMTINATPNY